jgi:NADH-quinone oxidoreductase subunit N
MTSQQIPALMPMIVLSLSAVVLMLQASVRRHDKTAWVITATGLLAAAWGAGYALNLAQQVTPLIVVDAWGLFLTLLILGASLVTLVLTGSGYSMAGQAREELYLLLLLATLGAVILVQANHMASFLLGLELMGIALYAMIAFPRRGLLPLEAAIKYLVLSAAASAMLLFGFALLYAATGDLSFGGMGSRAVMVFEANPVLIVTGLALILAGVGFKLSLVPFHLWTPDVYQGAPTAVTVFLATVSKGAIFAALARFFMEADLAAYAPFVKALAAVAIASMLVGNLLALRQDNLKRLLAYSSIAHFGYLVIILIAANARGVLVMETVTFYLTAYVVTTLAVFSVAALVAGDEDGNYRLEHFAGLFWRRPYHATVMTVAMLSLAGIPLTAGFIGKFYIINAGIQAGLWWSLAALVVGSAIAIYYYLRIIFAMCSSVASTRERGFARPGVDIMTAVLLLLILFLGSWPQPFMAFMGSL